jgi:hypothetical protein
VALIPSGMRLARALACTASLGVTAAPGPLPAQAASPSEYQLKAVFLFNFAQFVEWPAAAFASPGAPLVIGVLGEDPFGGYLDETVRGERVNDHPLVIERYRNVEEIGTCHILFVSSSELNQLETVFHALSNRPILTVGDVEGFATRGGMIRFATDHSRIGLRINRAAAEGAGLKLSSKLLRPAQIVTSGD